MPVVNIASSRLKKFLPGIKIDKALEILPFVGLDIEGVDEKVIRVEYNPNRPDFSSDYGIIRALRGLLGIETGIPKFKLAGKSGLTVFVDSAVKKTRPFIVALVAKNGRLDDETIKQIISMQEDLHNGVGRKRKKASIGIHNLDAIEFPIYYKVVSNEYSFEPLGEGEKKSINQILLESEIGRQYGHIFQGVEKYPIIIDSSGTTLSFPPIVNGNATRVDEKCQNLFIEVTAIDEKAANDILVILAATLYDAGFEIKTATINSGKKIETPVMKPKLISADVNFIGGVLGLDLDSKRIISCLRKSRLNAKIKGNKIVCTVPRYRIDISHPIDLAEEVAIGYGLFNMTPVFPSSPTAGQRNQTSVIFEAIRESLIGLGMLESISSSLTSKEIQYSAFDVPSQDVLSVDSSKSIEHEILRDSLIPSMLQSLSRNVHEEYPQKIFEIGKTFHKNKGISETWHVAAVIAHADANYSEIRSAAQALMRSCFGLDISTKTASNPIFFSGRTAEILVNDNVVGVIGEISPIAIEKFKLRVPLVGFEIDLTSIIKDK